MRMNMGVGGGRKGIIVHCDSVSLPKVEDFEG